MAESVDGELVRPWSDVQRPDGGRASGAAVHERSAGVAPDVSQSGRPAQAVPAALWGPEWTSLTRVGIWQGGHHTPQGVAGTAGGRFSIERVAPARQPQPLPIQSRHGGAASSGRGWIGSSPTSAPGIVARPWAQTPRLTPTGVGGSSATDRFGPVFAWSGDKGAGALTAHRVGSWSVAMHGLEPQHGLESWPIGLTRRWSGAAGLLVPPAERWHRWLGDGEPEVRAPRRNWQMQLDSPVMALVEPLRPESQLWPRSEIGSDSTSSPVRRFSGAAARGASSPSTFDRWATLPEITRGRAASGEAPAAFEGVSGRREQRAFGALRAMPRGGFPVVAQGRSGPARWDRGATPPHDLTGSETLGRLGSIVATHAELPGRRALVGGDLLRAVSGGTRADRDEGRATGPVRGWRGMAHGGPVGLSASVAVRGWARHGVADPEVPGGRQTVRMLAPSTEMALLEPWRLTPPAPGRFDAARDGTRTFSAEPWAPHGGPLGATRAPSLTPTAAIGSRPLLSVFSRPLATQGGAGSPGRGDRPARFGRHVLATPGGPAARSPLGPRFGAEDAPGPRRWLGLLSGPRGKPRVGHDNDLTLVEVGRPLSLARDGNATPGRHPWLGELSWDGSTGAGSPMATSSGAAAASKTWMAGATPGRAPLLETFLAEPPGIEKSVAFPGPTTATVEGRAPRPLHATMSAFVAFSRGASGSAQGPAPPGASGAWARLNGPIGPVIREVGQVGIGRSTAQWGAWSRRSAVGGASIVGNRLRQSGPMPLAAWPTGGAIPPLRVTQDRPSLPYAASGVQGRRPKWAGSDWRLVAIRDPAGRVEASGRSQNVSWFPPLAGRDPRDPMVGGVFRSTVGGARRGFTDGLAWLPASLAEHGRTVSRSLENAVGGARRGSSDALEWLPASLGFSLAQAGGPSERPSIGGGRAMARDPARVAVASRGAQRQGNRHVLVSAAPVVEAARWADRLRLGYGLSGARDEAADQSRARGDQSIEGRVFASHASLAETRRLMDVLRSRWRDSNPSVGRQRPRTTSERPSSQWIVESDVGSPPGALIEGLEGSESALPDRHFEDRAVRTENSIGLTARWATPNLDRAMVTFDRTAAQSHPAERRASPRRAALELGVRGAEPGSLISMESARKSEIAARPAARRLQSSVRPSERLAGTLFGDRGPRLLSARGTAGDRGPVLVETGGPRAGVPLRSTPGERPKGKAETGEEARHRLAGDQIDDNLSPEEVDEIAQQVIQQVGYAQEFDAARIGEEEWD